MTLPLIGQTVCPDGSQCIKQELVDKCAALADKYVAIKTALDATTKQIAALQLSNTDKDALIASLRQVGTINDQIGLTHDKLDAIKDAIIKTQADWIAQLEKKISNNKSFLQKLLVKLQVAYYILAGIAIVAK